FLEKKIYSVPAVEINDEAAISLKTNGSFNHSLREIVKNVLKRENYGKMAHIVVPIDFSESAINAFFYAQKLASDFDAVVDVVHVTVPLNFEIPDHQLLEIQMTSAEKELDQFVKKYDTDWGTDILKNAFVEGHSEVGFPADRIIHLGKKINAKMIIMGAGENDLLATIVGSTTKIMINNTTVPLLIVPKDAKFKPVKTIVLAIESEEDLKPSMEAIAEIKKIYNPKIYAVHHGPGVIDTYGFEEVSLILLDSGQAQERIDQFARSVDADILVVKKKQRNLLEKVFHKSFSNGVALTSPIPVLIIK
nr:universal stress protein [Saprospiraceae bacterium]